MKPKTLTFSFTALMILSGCAWVGGAFKYQPEQLEKGLSAGSRKLMEKAFADVDTKKLVDHHVHLVGLSPKVHGTFVNEAWQNFFSDPAGFIQFTVYKSAAAIDDESKADAQFLERLIKLVKYQPGQGRFGIMAFDYFHSESGQASQQSSTFRVPNDYALKIAQKNPDKFFPVISIHPYREDAIRDLTFYADQGIRFLKWLPNSMGIHPSSPDKQKQLKAFYAIMKKNNMVLISHTGDEKATHAEEYQHLGNPAYLTLPLSMGVKVVMGHLATLGVCKDNEVRNGICKQGEEYVDIAINMMKKKEYKDILFADISAITQYNRQHNIKKIILESSIHDRLINGSDYPLPAVNIVIRTGELQDLGYITREEREQLNEIYDYNPLLFDYVLKRTIKIMDKASNQPVGLPASIFMQNATLQSSPHLLSTKLLKQQSAQQ